MATDEERLIVSLEARVNDFEKQMKRAERTGTRTYQGLQRGSRSATRQMERDMVQSTTRINQALATTSAQIGAFGRSFAGGLAGGAATAALGMMSANIRQTLTGIAQIGDEAKRAGLGVEEFQQWSFVAQQNRIEIDALVDAFKELQLRADEFIVTGAGGGAEAFQRLGFTAEELARQLKNPSELMLEMFRRMESLDRAAQIRVFDEALGGQGGERFVELLSQGEDKLRDTMERARELGVVMDSEVIAKAAELDRKFGELEARVGSFLKQSLVDFGRDIETLQSELQPLVDTFERLTGRQEVEGQQFTDLQYQAAAAADEMRKLADTLDDVDEATEINALADEMEQLAFKFNQGTIKGEELATGVQDVKDRADEATTALEVLDTPAFDTVISRLGEVGDALLRVAGLGREAAASMPGDVGEHFGPVQEVWRNPDADLPERAKRAPERPSFEATENWAYGYEGKNTSGGAGGGGGAQDEDEYKARAEALREETAALEAEALALIAVSEAGEGYGDAIEYARRRAELLYAAQKEGKEITPELRAEIDQLALSYVNAAQKAQDTAQAMRDAKADAERGAEAMSDLFMSILDGSKTGKEALADLLAQLARVQMQKAMLQLAGGPGGGFFAALGGMLSARAGGGPVKAGTPYLVNENTPNSELFVPSQSGGILNVSQAQSALKDSIPAARQMPAAQRPGAGGGTSKMEVSLSPDLVGRILSQARGQATQIAARHSQAAAQRALEAAPQFIDDHNRRHR